MAEETQAQTQNDILNVLNEGDVEDTSNEEETLEVETNDEDEVEEEAKDEEIKLEDEETEEPKEEEEEFQFRGFDKKKFLKDFPDAFKKYPGLEKGYYTSRAYQEVFPTVADAKEASEKIDLLTTHQNALSNGSSVELFKALKEDSPESFNKVVNSYLSNLKEVDEPAYVHVIKNVLEDAILAVFNSGKDNKDEDLQTAARLFGGFLFGNNPIQGSKEFKPKDPETSKIDTERQKFNAERLSTYQSEVTSKVDKIVINTITKAIDPRDQMTPFTKRQAIREAKDLVDQAISNDSQLKSLLPKMWKNAEENKFSSEKLSKIEKALTSKAQVSLGDILRKVQKEALSGTQKREVTKQTTKTLPRSGGGNSSSTGTNKGGADKFKGLSTRQILELD